MMALQSETAPLTTIDGPAFCEMSRAALAWLQTNHQAVNALNVFPVPDGDTGTNMLLTMQAACAELEGADTKSVAEVAHLLAHGALMGARGNSGVILSQIWRGLARGLEDLKQFGAGEFTEAMQQATETAYRGVVRPVEGTILTVIKDASVAASTAVEKEGDLREFLQQVCSACEQSVQRTPDLLPVLEQAGVIDAGGFGLQLLFEGMLRHLRGEPVDVAPERDIKPLDLASIGSALETVEPGQDWEVVLDLRPKAGLNLDSLYGQLESMGTSIQVGEGDDILRVHIHLTEENRFKPIECAETLGTVVNVHMENLMHQMEQQAAASGRQVELQPGQLLAVAVAPGPGFAHIFAAPAVSVVSGGQTMNPSTQDLMAAFEDLPADQVIILPNNKNIQLAAEQAAAVSTKQVSVIPTRTVPQGVAALLSFDPDGVFDEICAAMRVGAGDVESGEITTATRSVTLNGHNVSEGQIIGLHNGEIACVGDTPSDCTLELLRVIGTAQSELVTLYYGEETDAAAAERLQAEIEACFPQVEVESYPGGQPHYHYILSVE
ncbi:MAG: DAK2 domain-containing protein [Anaerolineales bacterium]|nr:dihydroxyacetone kinase [Anaerolineaceae bacterium]MDP7644757.1 DAK2 domain-containing protein [Anaerolineales bacterium]